MMKFVVPTAIALGRLALGRWPILVAAVGGAVVHRMWSKRRSRLLSGSSVAAWAGDVTETSSSRPSGTTRTGSSSTPTTDAWSPTAPTGLF